MQYYYPVSRSIQIVTSEYGKRPGFQRFHNGVDLRSFNDKFTLRLPITLPEICIFDRAVYENDWGWTFFFLPTESGYYQLQFTHLQKNDRLIPDKVYESGSVVGFTAVTDYMVKKKYGEHLHFGVFEDKKKTIDPLFYFNNHFSGCIEWDYSDGMKKRGFIK